jgi:HK97 family phage major capsid protein
MNLQEKLQHTLGQMDALNLTVIDGERDFTAEEQAQYGVLEAQAKVMQEQIERSAKLTVVKQAANMPAQTVASQQPIYHAPADPAAKEFESMAEFLGAVAFNKDRDQRLASLYTEFSPSADGSMGEGGSFGFLIPKQFSQNIYKVTEQDNIIRARATVIPAGSPPDAEFSMPALNQGSGSNMFGGVSTTWIAEGATAPKTDIKTREIIFKPNEVLGIFKTTQKALRNLAAASTLIEKQFRQAVLGAEDQAFFRGNGVGKPLGIIASGATLKVNRAVANVVSYADLRNMVGKGRVAKGYAYAWLINPALLPQLLDLKNTTANGGNGELIFKESGLSGMPPMLMGYPVIWYERASQVGSLGDIVWVDLSEYYIKDGSGPFVGSDGGFSGTNYDENKVSFKITWNVDGRPPLDGPYTLENNQTVSPFVVLDIPA